MTLFLREIADRYVRKNFEALRNEMRVFSLYRAKFKHFEIVIPQAVTNYRFPHRFGYRPKDILQTSLTGAGSLTWNYDRFDAEYLDITTTGACTVRAFVGSYEEGSQA